MYERVRGGRGGIEIAAEPYPHVRVGADGRGRFLARFPVGQRFADSLRVVDTDTRATYSPIERASVIRTKEHGTLLLVEEKDPADLRALVLFRAHGGFRGYSELCSPEMRGTVTFERFFPAAPAEFDFLPGVKFLAAGYDAEGAAGRAGGPHWEALLIMEPGAAVRAEFYGRLYGGPGHMIVLWDGAAVRAGTRDEVWPPSCEAAEGEVL
jgi:hypothetical protein